MLRKTLFAFGVLATLGAAAVATSASAAPANGVAIRDAASIKSDVTSVGYYGYSYYYPRHYSYHHYYPRYHGYRYGY
jgi:hypothetical protein